MITTRIITWNEQTLIELWYNDQKSTGHRLRTMTIEYFMESHLNWTFDRFLY